MILGEQKNWVARDSILIFLLNEERPFRWTPFESSKLGKKTHVITDFLPPFGSGSVHAVCVFFNEPSRVVTWKIKHRLQKPSFWEVPIDDLQTAEGTIGSCDVCWENPGTRRLFWWFVRILESRSPKWPEHSGFSECNKSKRVSSPNYPRFWRFALFVWWKRVSLSPEDFFLWKWNLRKKEDSKTQLLPFLSIPLKLTGCFFHFLIFLDAYQEASCEIHENYSKHLSLGGPFWFEFADGTFLKAKEGTFGPFQAPPCHPIGGKIVPKSCSVHFLAVPLFSSLRTKYLLWHSLMSHPKGGKCPRKKCWIVRFALTGFQWKKTSGHRRCKWKASQPGGIACDKSCKIAAAKTALTTTCISLVFSKGSACDMSPKTSEKQMRVFHACGALTLSKVCQMRAQMMAIRPYAWTNWDIRQQVKEFELRTVITIPLLRLCGFPGR